MLSVVIAAYNVGDCIERCIASVMPQLGPEIELIVVDDGSTDFTPAIVKRMISNSPYSKLLQQPNKGLSMARNAGINAAHGNLIMLIDGDDYIAPDCLAPLLHTARQLRCDVLQFGYEEIDDLHPGSPSAMPKPTIVADRHEMWQRLYSIGGEAASACTKIYRRHIFNSLKFKPRRLHEDEFFVTGLLSAIGSMAYITEYKPYKYVRNRNGAISASFTAARCMHLIDMYHARLLALAQAGYDDIAQTTSARYFTMLRCACLKALDRQHFELARVLQQQGRKISASAWRADNLTDTVAKWLFRLGLPAFDIAHMLRGKQKA